MIQLPNHRWEPTNKQLTRVIVTLIILAFSIIVICGYIFGWDWTGFNNRELWDWLKLLLAVAVPAILAYYGQRISTLQYRGQQEAEEQRAQDEALQAYLDHMSQLLTDKDQPFEYQSPQLLTNRDRPLVTEISQLLTDNDQTSDSSYVDDNANVMARLSVVARVRTLTVLQRLNGTRKGSVVQFLQESGLITAEEPLVSLSGADLNGVNLQGANLSGANLRESNLQEANLDRAQLQGANLRSAILDRANLGSADLQGADLQATQARATNFTDAILTTANLRFARLTRASLGATLAGATLYGAILQEADLRGANLRGASLAEASLNGADLADAIVTGANLAEASSLDGAVLPSGQRYEDWIER
jgi:uncharacterized protein YjbI with pentapeptide repeats